MSADREPTAVEVIAEALVKHYPSTWQDADGEQKCSCGQWLHYKALRDRETPEQHQAAEVLAALKAAGFVVATRDEIQSERLDAARKALWDVASHVQSRLIEVQP